MCTPYIESQKMVAMAASLRTSKWLYQIAGPRKPIPRIKIMLLPITQPMLIIAHEKPKMVAMAKSLRCMTAWYRQYLHSVGWPLKLPSITNCLVAIILTKPVIVILVPTLVAMAMTLRHSISAMCSSDSFTRKPTTGIKQCVASYHTTKVIAHQRP